MMWSCVAAVVALLPWAALRRLGAGLGWLAGSVLRIRRAHTQRAMRVAGVPCAPADVRAVYASLGTNVFELLWSAARRATDRVDVDPASWARLQRQLDAGRGLVVATAHTGNWDLLGCAMAERVPLTVVTKHLSWRSLDRFWQGLRSEHGVRLVDPGGALAEASATLRKGGVVAFIIDQAPERTRGVVRFPFLGEQADHDTTFATVAARHRAPVAVVCDERRADGGHTMHVLHIEDAPERASRAWTTGVVRRAGESLERFVREHPSQWLWLHRRWKAGAGDAVRNTESAREQQSVRAR